MQLKSIVAMLKKRDATAADLRQSLAEIDVDAAEREADSLEAERRRILLHSDDADLAAIEERIVTANRGIERLVAAREELTSRLAEAEEREAAAELDALLAATSKEAAAVTKAVETAYPRLAGELVTLLRRLDAAEEQIEATNARLQAAGRPERVEGVQDRIFPKRKSTSPHWRYWHLGAEIRLPHIRGFADGWNEPSSGAADQMDREVA